MAIMLNALNGFTILTCFILTPRLFYVHLQLHHVISVQALQGLLFPPLLGLLCNIIHSSILQVHILSCGSLSEFTFSDSHFSRSQFAVRIL